MIHKRLRLAGRRGAAAVELAVVLSLLSTLLLGAWEVGRMVEIQQIMNNAAREGGRQASTGQLDQSQVTQVVRQYLKDAGIPATTAQNANVAVVNLGYPGNPSPPDNNPKNATELDRIQVTVSIPLDDVRWIKLYVVTSSSTTITGESIWSCMKDLAYPDPTPPDGF